MADSFIAYCHFIFLPLFAIQTLMEGGQPIRFSLFTKKKNFTDGDSPKQLSVRK